MNTTQPVTDQTSNKSREGATNYIRPAKNKNIEREMNTKKAIRVMVIGDYLIFRSGLKLLLESENAVRFVGEAANLEEAARTIRQIKPEVLLINATEIDDAETFFSDIQTAEKPIIVLTNSRTSEMQKKYLLLGVNGIVSKEQTASALFVAIEKVSEGDVYFDRKLMNETIKQLVREKKSLPEKLFALNCATLTEREREVLALVCRGKKNKVIADELFVTETTVRHHLTSIFEKLKVASRLELVVHAFREKLVEIPFEPGETADNSTLSDTRSERHR